MDYIESKNRKREIEEQISKLNKEYREITNSEIEYYQEKLKPLVGLCFKYCNKYVVILDVPKVEYTMMDTLFNSHKLPAMFIGQELISEKSLIPIYEDNFYTDAGDYDDPLSYFNRRYKVISRHEFEDVLNQKMKLLLSSVFHDSVQSHEEDL